MKKHFILLAFALCAAAMTARAQFSGGNGSQDNPYIVASPQELSNLRNYLGSGAQNTYFELGNAIDLAAYLAPGGDGYAAWGSAGWLPVGSSGNPFYGKLDGGGYSITGLWIDRTGDYRGLFGVTAAAAVIENLGVEIGAQGITGGGYVGGLVGYNGGSIDNCFVGGGAVTGSGRVGGLAGYLYNGSIVNCHATAAVTASNWAGGLVGDQVGYRSQIMYCYAAGAVHTRGDRSGGLVGGLSDNGLISDCYAIGAVSGGSWVGGILGHLYGGRLINCYATGAISGYTVGGVVGLSNSGSVPSNCFFDKETTGRSNGVGSGSQVGTIGETTANMKRKATFANAEWNFKDVWVIKDGSDYPGFTLLPSDLLITYTATGAEVTNEEVVSFDGSRHTIKLAGDYTVAMRKAGDTTKVEHIVVDANCKIVLDNVNIRTDSSPISILAGSAADITIRGNNLLEATTIDGSSAGLHVPTNAAVTINGSITDTLMAMVNYEDLIIVNVGFGAAGIGGAQDEGGGTITINGGVIQAIGSYYGAGIGGGANQSGSGFITSGGIITINGGSIMAASIGYGAGIGGGFAGVGGTILITGGEVLVSTDSGACIGGGYSDGRGDESGSGGNITISGGIINSHAGPGVGIGGGFAGAGGTITISGGTITTEGGSGNNEIGKDVNYTDGTPGTVTITGGSIKAGNVNPAPTNNGGNSVYLNTLDFDPAVNAGVAIVAGYIDNVPCDISPTPGAGRYGIHDVMTDDDGKLYFWLPATSGDKPVALTAGSKYKKDYTRLADNTNAETLLLSDLLITHTATGAEVAGGDSVSFDGSQHTINRPGNYTIAMRAAGSTTTTEYVTVNTTCNIILDNIKITTDTSPISILAGSAADIILKGNNVLEATITNGSSAGLHVPTNAVVTINGSITDTLRATGSGGGIVGAGAAGIGGSQDEGGGAITINGGTIIATGNNYGAGIGGGTGRYGTGSIASGGIATITGGKIIAKSNRYGAGIGGGWAGAGGTIIITGGEVIAISGTGAGIGGGDSDGRGGNSGNGGTITISGGIITAISGNYIAYVGSAGIGGGNEGGGGNINISGGTINATGESGFGIGHQNGGTPGTVTITGGSIKASGSAGTIDPQPTNGSNLVYLNTLDFSPTLVSGVPINARYVGGVRYYGLHDVQTDDVGQVYFWLPASTAGGDDQIVLAANDGLYTGDNSPHGETNANAQTLTFSGTRELIFTNDDAYGELVVDQSIVEFDANAHTHTIYGTGNYIVSMNGVPSTSTESVVVESSCGITLKNIQIKNSSKAPIAISAGNIADITFVGKNELFAGSSYDAALRVLDGATVTLKDIGNDTLIVATGGDGAGIGGNKYENSGNINIIGGTIIAINTDGGVGIGDEGGSDGVITISGGMVNASEIISGTVIITGGSINVTDTIMRPTNGNNPVYLNTLSFDPAVGNAVPITAGAINGVPCDLAPIPATGKYGIHDVVTDPAGKLYFWLPATGGNQQPVNLTANGIAYKDVYVRSANNTNSSALHLSDLVITHTATGINALDDGSASFDGNEHIILSSGNYTVAMRTGIEISVTENVVVNADCDITLNKVNIQMINYNGVHAPVSVANAKTAVIALVGRNTLEAANSNDGLHISDNATVVIGGNTGGSTRDTLIAMSNDGAGIGGDAGSKITIVGATLIAEGDIAGIGSNAVSNITIVGGTVIATGTNADIRSATGGSIAIIGGSVNASKILPAPTNGVGQTVFLDTLLLKSPAIDGNTAIATASINNVPCVKATPDASAGEYGINDVFTDNNSRLYFWLPATGGSPEVISLSPHQAGIYAEAFVRSSVSREIPFVVPPTVAGTLPTDVAVDTAGILWVAFSESMNTEIGEIALSPATSLTFLRWAATRDTVYYNFSGLNYDEIYTYTVSGFADVAGNPMKEDDVPHSFIVYNVNAAVTIAGAEETTPFHFMVKCDNNHLNNFTVAVSSENSTATVWYNGELCSTGTFEVELTQPGVDSFVFTVRSADGLAHKDYSLKIEKYFNFFDIAEQWWNNTLVVNNNPAVNGGYSFADYQWFCNDELISAEQSYSAGNNSVTDHLNWNASYYVAVHTTAGELLRTCAIILTPDLTSDVPLEVFPNPASTDITIVNDQWETTSEIQLIGINGQVVKTFPTTGKSTTVSVSGLASGMYVVRAGKRTKMITIQ